jgi:hypothetical protein
MTTETPTLDQVLDLAHRLPRTQRAELVAQIVRELAAPESAANIPSPEDPWQRLDHFRDELATLSPASPTLAEQLDRDRRERQAMIEGSGHGHA